MRRYICAEQVMIKKTGHIILVLILLFATTGITISKHYCGNKLRSVTVNTEPVSCCDTEGCCHNESQTFKVEDDFAATTFQFEFEQIALPVPQEFAFELFRIPAFISYRIYYDRPSPPDLRSYLASIQTFIL